MAEPTIASGALRKLLVHCGEVGIDRDDLVRELAIDVSVIDDPDARVPVAQVHATWDAMYARAPRLDGALLGAERYAPGDYGLVGFVVMTSATVDEALGQFVRFSGLWTDEPVFSREGPIVRIEYRSIVADSFGKRMATESAFTEIVHAARIVTGKRTVPRAVRFTHAAPRDRSHHDTFFGCAVEFGAARNELELSPEDLALALPRADPQLGAYLRQAASEALARRGGDVDAASPIERARAIMAEDLPRALPTLETVAKRLAISPRTLRRRLEEAGTSFRELLDDTRAELARGYVRDRRIPLAEVAFLLGFSEPSTFHRAFKRWTNVTPAAWRKGA